MRKCYETSYKDITLRTYSSVESNSQLSEVRELVQAIRCNLSSKDNMVEKNARKKHPQKIKESEKRKLESVVPSSPIPDRQIDRPTSNPYPQTPKYKT